RPLAGAEPGGPVRPHGRAGGQAAGARRRGVHPPLDPRPQGRRRVRVPADHADLQGPGDRGRGVAAGGLHPVAEGRPDAAAGREGAARPPTQTGERAAPPAPRRAGGGGGGGGGGGPLAGAGGRSTPSPPAPLPRFGGEGRKREAMSTTALDSPAPAPAAPLP